MRVIVTGGSGFIGTNLVEHFVGRGDVVLNIDAVSPRNIAHGAFWRRVDLCEAERLREAIHEFSPDVILHMAARTDLDGASILDYRANTDGVRNMIDAVQGLKKLQRIIFASSRLVCRIGYEPRDETDYSPTTVYGESKIIGERIVRDAQNDIPCPWVIVRPTSIWGPWFDIPYKTFFLAIASGRYFHPGHMKILKSFGYVGNTVYQLNCLLDAEAGAIHRKTLYLADYPPIDVMEMADRIRHQSGAPSIRHVGLPWLRLVAKAGDLLKSIGWNSPPLTTFRLDNLITPMVHDLEPLRSLVGELPYSMEEGIGITINWLRKNGQIN